MRKFTSLSTVLLALATTGCSSDVMRFSDPFSNPFTASTSRQTARTTTAYKPQTFPTSGKVRPSSSDDDIITGTNRKIQEVKQLPYNENVQRAWDNRGVIKSPLKLPPRPMQMQMKTGGWSAIGGTAISARAGDTVKSLSERYGVPASAIATANGIDSTAILSNGKSIIIPTYSLKNNTSATAKIITPEKTQIIGLRSQQQNDEKIARDLLASKKKQPSYARNKREHIIAPGDSLLGLANRYQVKREDIAKANRMGEWDQLKIGKALIIPAVTGTVIATKPAVKPVTVAKALKSDNIVTGSIAPSKKTSAVKQLDDKPVKTAAMNQETNVDLDFRWPVRGAARVISNFGDDINGTNNEGINFSVPEGTEIRAAEDGEVAYASTGARDPNLKTYGNLILIRHKDRYVTAYAHAKDISVKVGEQVKRGQVIGRVGQTGSVSTPQLHFEIRQGKSSINPEKMIKS